MPVLRAGSAADTIPARGRSAPVISGFEAPGASPAAGDGPPGRSWEPSMTMTQTSTQADDLALTLFRQWIDAARASDQQGEIDDDDDDPAFDLMVSIENQIAQVRGGTVSLAIKTFL